MSSAIASPGIAHRIDALAKPRGVDLVALEELGDVAPTESAVEQSAPVGNARPIGEICLL